MFDETADEIGKDTLIANRGRDAVTVERGDCVFGPRDELPDLPGETLGKEEQALEWHIFAKRHKVHLVVPRNLVALGIQ